MKLSQGLGPLRDAGWLLCSLPYLTPLRSLYHSSQALRSIEVVSKEVDSRSLYVRPFPMDTTVDNLLTFFGAQGEVCAFGAPCAFVRGRLLNSWKIDDVASEVGQ